MRRLLPVLIGLLSVLAFLPALGGQFLAWDDDVNLVTNPWYRGLGWPEIRWAFSNVRMGHYIPLTWLSFSANYAAGGMSPWGYHLVNLLLHGANAITFYLVARRLLAAARDGGSQARRGETAMALTIVAAACGPASTQVTWTGTPSRGQPGGGRILALVGGPPLGGELLRGLRDGGPVVRPRPHRGRDRPGRMR